MTVVLYVKEGITGKWRRISTFNNYDEAKSVYNKQFKGRFNKYKILFDEQVNQQRVKQELTKDKKKSIIKDLQQIYQ